MMLFYGKDLLDKLSVYYGERLRTAKEYGFEAPDAKFNWLYLELDFRVKLLRQVRLFLNVLPEFLTNSTEDAAMQYVVGFTSPWFTEKYIGNLPSDKEGGCVYFHDSNPYWAAISEVMDNMDTDSDFSVLPMFYLTLCEYVIRNLRLYFFLREQLYKPIDREKFDELMMPDDGLCSYV